jgi:pyridoxine kinase
MVAVDAEAAWLVSTPRLARTFTGSGDLTAAIFLATELRGWDLPRTLAHTAAVIYGILKITNDLGRTELALIAAQHELIHPSHAFKPVRLR